MNFARSRVAQLSQFAHNGGPLGQRLTRVAETGIGILAATAVVAMVGAFTPELLWAGLAASFIYALGMG